MGKRWDRQCLNCDQRVGLLDNRDDYNPWTECTNMMDTTNDDGCGIYCWHVLKITKCPVCGGELSARVRGTRGCMSCNWTFTVLDQADGTRK